MKIQIDCYKLRYTPKQKRLCRNGEKSIPKIEKIATVKYNDIKPEANYLIFMN